MIPTKDLRYDLKHDQDLWEWDTNLGSQRILVTDNNKGLILNPDVSRGSVTAKGNKFMENDRFHYWELLMLSPIYGTDIMVGVGTDNVDITSHNQEFCSGLGRDEESWGFSYKGYVQHAGRKLVYAAGFTQGNIVGVFLDTWQGILRFSIDRRLFDIASNRLKNKLLYPMVSSTCVDTKIKIIFTTSLPVTLQTTCLFNITSEQKYILSENFPMLHYLSESIFTRLKRKGDEVDNDGNIVNREFTGKLNFSNNEAVLNKRFSQLLNL